MDVIELHRRAVAATGGIIERVDERRLDTPTPCTKWSIRQIIQHMVDNNRSHVVEVRGESVVDTMGTDFRSTSAAFLDVFHDVEVLARPFTLGGLPSNGYGVVAVQFADVLVHGWDIGRAASMDITFDEELAGAALRITEQFPDTPAIRGPNGAFAAPVPVPHDAPLTDRLLAFTGRDPDWRAVSLPVHS